jgi:Rad3-related DNA helicase
MQKVRNVSERGRICFEEAAATFSKRVRESPEGYIQKVRFRKDDNPLSEIPEVVDEFERALLDLKQGLTELHEWMQDLQDGTFPMQEELTAELLGQVAKWHGIAEDVRFLTSAEEEGYVYWGELPAKGEERRLNRLVAVPRDVSRHLKETLYPRLQTAIFTSATLAVRGKFSYLIRRLGLDLRKTETLALLSPFNYEEQAVICLPQFLPSPKTEVFVTMVGQAIGELILRVRRGTLVLFTSYGMLQRVYRMVKPQAASEKITLLGQGIDGERSHLLSTFREEPGSVLLGVDSFWEGIDLPGEALEMLIITRLPFAVPTEPIVEAHLEEVAKGGKDPFLHYSIPEAALRLRQGFGRLIRNRTDRGVVVVMDSRTTTTTFGRVFLDVLPAPKRTFRSLQELIDGINAWFEKH